MIKHGEIIMKILFFTLMLIPFSISAQQTNTSMNNQVEMEKMMKSMQEMQNCMMKIDKNEIIKLEKKTQAFDKEIQALCIKGKREQAQQRAKNIFKNMVNDPVSKKLKECTDIMKNMPSQFEVKESHVCDSPENDFQG